MAYCRKCGMEIDDEAVVCVHCGVPTDRFQKTVGNGEDKTSILLVIASFFMPVIGFIIGAVYISGGKKNAGKNYVGAAFIALSLFLLLIILGANASSPE
ncbi:MAG: zinc ribbon domain-containing protein [Ruminococcus sp.]|nr:zinc ribbon domain-containing protein [Ruminococcus sp.]